MRDELQRIDFAYFADNLTRVFEQVRDRNEPILVERDGETYRVEKEEPHDIWANYDPDKVQQALAASRGIFTGTDADAFLEEMHEQRQQGANRFD